MQLENAIQEAMAELDRMSEKEQVSSVTIQSSEFLENMNHLDRKKESEEQSKAAVPVGRLRSSHR